MTKAALLSSVIESKEPSDADLTAIAALTGTSGLLKKTATNTWTLDTSDNIGTATKLQTPRKINDATFDGSADVVVSTIYDSNNTRITNPPGGRYVTASSTVTGAITIVLPVGMTSTMTRITAKVFEYSTNRSFNIYIGGYNYSVSGWVNTFAYIVGNPNTDARKTVRFGKNAAGKAVIYIGELTTTWSYPQVFVTEAQLGYNGYGTAAWVDNWNIVFTTSAFENVSATISDCQVGYATSTNVANADVRRDAAGNFAANSITVSAGFNSSNIFSFLNSGAAQGIKVGSLVIDSTYATNAPTNGLYVKGQLQSGVTTGTAPLIIASTTRVANLNVATAGSADTATKLTTPRAINGVNFDGTAAITIYDATKEPTITAGTTSQYWRGDKTWQTLDSSAVGLGNVSNLTDVNRSVGSFVVHDTRSVVSSPDNLPAKTGLFEFKLNTSVGNPPYPSHATYTHVLTINGWTSDGSGGWPTQLGFGTALNMRQGTSATTWGPWKVIVDSTNIGNYAPTLSGTGATGTWGISISGNAATATNVAYSGLTGTVPTWNQNTTGNAGTATKLATARTINGVAFDGSANITVADSTKVPLNGTGATGTWGISITGNAATATNVAYSGLTGTVPTWNQNTTGNAATATNVAYSGLTGTVPTWNQNTTGNAATATKLQTARTINGVNFDGTANITIADSTKVPLNGTGATGTWGISISGNAATATKLQTARTINGVNFDGSANITISAASAYALTPGSYITGSSYNGSAAVTFAVDATTTATANKVVARDGSGNTAVNELYSTAVKLNSIVTNSTATITTTSVAQTALLSLAVSTYAGTKIVIQATRAGERHITELLVLHNGTVASSTEYGSIITGSSLFTTDVDISGGSMRILVTSSTSTSTVYKATYTTITI